MPLQPTHVVDAAAVIAYLKGETGQDRFAALLEDPRNVLAIHSVNLCEIYYNYLRSDSVEIAEQAWEKTTQMCAVIDRLDDQFVKRVARWKGVVGLGLGDAFAAATAEEYACQLVTTDHRDFDPIDQSGQLKIFWLRPAA